MLERTAPVEVKRQAVNAATGAFAGYASVFGNRDAYDDVVAPGAFTESLGAWKARKRMPPMLLQHGAGFGGTAEDGIPVGHWLSMAEDRTGLRVEGQLHALETQKAKYILEGLQSGSLSGLSVGYVPTSVTYGQSKKDPARVLNAVQLWECSIVTFPANDAARVDEVKHFESPRELETFLRHAGLPRAFARKMVASSWDALRSGREDADSAARIVSALEAATAALHNPKR